MKLDIEKCEFITHHSWLNLRIDKIINVNIYEIIDRFIKDCDNFFIPNGFLLSKKDICSVVNLAKDKNNMFEFFSLSLEFRIDDISDLCLDSVKEQKYKFCLFCLF